MGLLGKNTSGGRKNDDSSDDSDAEGIAPGTASLVSGLDQFSLDGESLALTAAMEQQREQKRRIISVLSPNARAMLEPGYCHDIDLNSDGDEVSSMNDSIYFGGGASVAGFRGMTSLSPTDEACVSPVAGTSPEKPIKLLGDDKDDADTLESGDMFKEGYEQLDVDITAAQRNHLAVVGSASPNAGVISESESEQDEKDTKKSFFPAWIERTPLRFKLILMVIIAFLFGASIVGMVMVFTGDDTDSSSSAQDPLVTTTTLPPAFYSPTEAPTDLPTLSPTPAPTVGPTLGPTTGPTDRPTSSPTSGPTEAPTDGPSASPSNAPTALPTGGPTSNPSSHPTLVISPTQSPTVLTQAPVTEKPVNPTNFPTAVLDESVITVYLTTGEHSSNVMESAASLPSRGGASFLVHLGDWNDPDKTGCDQSAYQETSQIFQSSSVPVYFVVGDNEVNNCPNQDQANKLWQEYFVGYETNYWDNPSWDIYRQGDLSKDYKNYDENFLFAYEKAAFASINLVGGENEERKVDTRLEANRAWVETAYMYFRNEVDTIFILANVAPFDSNENNDEFYSDLFDDIQQKYSDMNFVLVNRSESTGFAEKYNGIDNLDLVLVPDQVWPPLRMTVDFSGSGRSIDFSTGNKNWNKKKKEAGK